MAVTYTCNRKRKDNTILPTDLFQIILLSVSLCTVCMQCLRRPEEGVRCPRTGVIDGVSHHMVLGIESGSFGRAAIALNR